MQLFTVSHDQIHKMRHDISSLPSMSLPIIFDTNRKSIILLWPVFHLHLFLSDSALEICDNFLKVLHSVCGRVALNECLNECLINSSLIK